MVGIVAGGPNGKCAAVIYGERRASLIWMGARIMEVVGALAMSDTRFRIGVGRRARKAAAINPMPAE